MVNMDSLLTQKHELHVLLSFSDFPGHLADQNG